MPQLNRYHVTASETGGKMTYYVSDIYTSQRILQVFRSDVELARRVAEAMNLLEEQKPRPLDDVLFDKRGGSKFPTR